MQLSCFNFQKEASFGAQNPSSGPAVAAGNINIFESGHGENANEQDATDTLASMPNRLLMQQIMDAWATLNPANAGKYYDKSTEEVFFDDAGGVKFIGWQAYEDGIREVMKVLQAVKWTVNDDAVVHRGSKYAWGTATVHADIAYKNGRHQLLDERWTLVWAKKGTKWLVVHEHFSAPLEMQ